MVDYKNKKIVIIGIGITGLSCVDFFLAKGITPRIMDTRLSPPGLLMLPKQIEYYIGGINNHWLEESDMIIISPGISLAHTSFNKAIELGIEIIGDIELFCREINQPIVAITGSNGKSTVTALVGEMARTAGWSVGIGGNIGCPVLRLLKVPAQFYVLEISSFQLETIYSLKAAAATILNIKEDHMDRYPLGIKQYQSSKLRIYENANFCIVNADDDMTLPIHNINKNIISFGINIGDYSLDEQKGNIWLKIKGKKVLNANSMKIFGRHNYLNALAALALADAVNIPRESNLKTLTRFAGLPHRLQLVHESNGVRWINDSKATNVSSTESAFCGLQLKGKLWLLLGGDGKSANFSPLLNYIQNKNIQLFCFGRDRHVLASLCPNIAICTETLEQAMKQIAAKVQPGDTVLLSPACSSLDQFQNFEHRGNVFTELAKKLS